MKKSYRIISLILTVVMLLGSLGALTAVGVYAAPTTGTGTVYPEPLDKEVSKEDYTQKIYYTEQEKLDSMRLAFSNYGFYLYVDDFSGEVAIVNPTTGEKLFTNPWDVGSDKASDVATDASTEGSIKEKLLSQIEITFTDTLGKSYNYSSFRMAAMKDQITVKNILNGIRVEYTIGREQSKMLVPHHIEKDRYEKLISAPIKEALETIDNHNYLKFLTYYTPVSIYKLDSKGNVMVDANGNKVEESDAVKAELLSNFPALKNIDIMYVLPSDDVISVAELTFLEEKIKECCPDYSYEEMDYDHERTMYISADENPPVFKLALEYTIDAKGLTVRLPANGIRFNESLYTLQSITVLPYMGAGNNWYEGYNFMPDGSGAIYEFDSFDASKAPTTIYNQVYGNDYAYHELSGTYEKTIRYPVFGTVEKSSEWTYTTVNNVTGDETVTKVADVLISKYENDVTRDSNGDKKRFPKLDFTSLVHNSMSQENIETTHGFVAIIEEGEALTSIASYHGGNQNDYNSVKMQITPRPSDTYSLQESLSVSALGEMTIVSERKYLGNYKIRYIMLSDADKALTEGNEVYDASWFGMATAYRDYLTDMGILTPLTEDDVNSSIPLYIESFGAMETTEKILSIPVERMTAMTTFEDIKTMYSQLSEENGITNINFKLTGFANGGMYSTVPGKLKWEKAVGGKDGFQELLDHAADVSKKENSTLGIFPDFDFVYITSESTFDGVSLSKHAAKTIDDRYASRRVYSATQQKYVNYYDLIISPAYFAEFYEKLTENYLEYNNISGISLGSLGNSLNSDFDEDEPYNREDAKEYTVKAFQYFDSADAFGNAQIMTSGGNAYTWKYVDHILDVALDSSNQNRSSGSVPFIGVVLHGSVQFAGDPLNMEGDIKSAMLKAIENGASPYFVLSYRNTQNLKEDSVLSKYYSIRYDIWKEDLISTYNTLNGVLGDVQDKYIIGHQYIEGSRIPDEDEVEADALAALKKYLEIQNNKAEHIIQELAGAVNKAREEGRLAEAYVMENLEQTIEKYLAQQEHYITLIGGGVTYEDAKAAYDELEAARVDNPALATTIETYIAASISKGGSYAEYTTLFADYQNKSKAESSARSALRAYERDYYNAVKDQILGYENPDDMPADLREIYETHKAYEDDYNAKAELSDAASKAVSDYTTAHKTAGSLDKLVAAKAAMDARAEYAQYADSTDENEQKLYQLYLSSYNTYTKSARNTFYLNLTKLAGYNYRTFVPVIETAGEYVLRAEAAISVIAAEMDPSIVDAEGNLTVDIYSLSKDELGRLSYITREAINRARTVKAYYEDDIYEMDTKGVLTDNTLANGAPLFRFRQEDGTYFYIAGSVETGYSYYSFEKFEADGTVELVPFGTASGTDTFDDKQVYTYKEDGKSKYYVMDDEAQRYVYLTRKQTGFEIIEDVVRDGELVTVLNDGTEIYRDDAGCYAKTAYGYINYIYSESYKGMLDTFEGWIAEVKDIAINQAGIPEADINSRLESGSTGGSDKDDEDIEEDTSDVVEEKYFVDNVVVVTYGNADGTAYKHVILNYNDYMVKVEFGGIEYTIAAYDFVGVKA